MTFYFICLIKLFLTTQKILKCTDYNIFIIKYTYSQSWHRNIAVDNYLICTT